MYRIMPVSLQRLAWCFANKKDKFLYKHDSNVFESIYKNWAWGTGESRSGGGSYIETTKKIREVLPELWEEYNIKTVLDVPCGDYNWMKEVEKKNIVYIGGDIVKEVVEENIRKYRKENIEFKVIDIIHDELPSVDMIFCKDCLQHLSDENVFKALLNFKKSGSKYLLTTSYPLTLKNWNIYDGDYRPLNLRIKPFELPVPIYKVRETSKGYGMEKDKWMFLYELGKIKSFGCLKQ